MAEWKRYGLLGFTINLQGGIPEILGGVFQTNSERIIQVFK